MGLEECFVAFKNTRKRIFSSLCHLNSFTFAMVIGFLAHFTTFSSLRQHQSSVLKSVLKSSYRAVPRGHPKKVTRWRATTIFTGSSCAKVQGTLLVDGRCRYCNNKYIAIMPCHGIEWPYLDTWHTPRTGIIGHSGSLDPSTMQGCTGMKIWPYGNMKIF